MLSVYVKSFDSLSLYIVLSPSVLQMRKTSLGEIKRLILGIQLVSGRSLLILRLVIPTIYNIATL